MSGIMGAITRTITITRSITSTSTSTTNCRAQQAHNKQTVFL